MPPYLSVLSFFFLMLIDFINRSMLSINKMKLGWIFLFLIDIQGVIV